MILEFLCEYKQTTTKLSIQRQLIMPERQLGKEMEYKNIL